MKNYFSHDENARNDPKLIRVLMRHGQAGIGVYWCLIEMLYEQGGYLMRSDCESYAFALRTDCELIESLIDSTGLFSYDNDRFWSESVLRRLGLRKMKSEKASQSARSRWENANEMRSHSDSNANKVKESKLKESKLKEKKEKEIDSSLSLTIKKEGSDDDPKGRTTIRRVGRQKDRSLSLTDCPKENDNDFFQDVEVEIDDVKTDSGSVSAPGGRGPRSTPGQTPTERPLKVTVERVIPFGEWWTLYDNKKGRDEAEKKWNNRKLLSDDDLRDIMEHTRRYVTEEAPDKQYRKHPSTYLNKKAWKDEIVVRKNRRTDESLEDFAREIDRRIERDRNKAATYSPGHILGIEADPF